MTATNDNVLRRAELPPENVEVWSGKGTADENFPVGSFLIRADLRRHVHAYYAFARNADDIGDHPDLAAAEKINRLETMQAVLEGRARDAQSPSAARLKISLAETGVDAAHATDLLVAFRQDALQSRYEDWPALMRYCRYSAAPVGRYMLALHGENIATWSASDALCTSLQVLNHLQDCAADLRALDRCYLPQDWLAQEGATTDDVAKPASSPSLRRVFDRMLAATEALNLDAERLPPGVKAGRLRVETGIIVGLAKRLTRRLKAGDPLAARVKLSRLDIMAATAAAARYIA